MRLDEFDFYLPDERIALHPTEPRDHSRLLAVDRTLGTMQHLKFYQLETLLRPGDVLVLNNSKVLPARLLCKDEQGRPFEVFLLQPVVENPGRWDCLVKPGRRLINKSVRCTLGGIELQVIRNGDAALCDFPKEIVPQLLPWLETYGLPPLPPYIKRQVAPEDRARYQTVYAKRDGSVAAPTAGLHFTTTLLDLLRAKGVEVLHITLHVGYGTFSPVRSETVEAHRMHQESFHIPEETLASVRRAKTEGRRIIAVGTTSLRALESVARFGAEGRTDIFISPGYQFQWVDGLITNFHLPKSTLIILVAALLGIDRVKACYAEAIREGYGFYSYGDAMAILKP